MILDRRGDWPIALTGFMCTNLCFDCYILKTTRYFEEQVLPRRPYIKREWCQRAIQEPVQKEIQINGRIRYWIYITELGKYLRVVTLEDGKTIHNAFPDRNFKN
jgi:hypothetical protein